MIRQTLVLVACLVCVVGLAALSAGCERDWLIEVLLGIVDDTGGGDGDPNQGGGEPPNEDPPQAGPQPGDDHVDEPPGALVATDGQCVSGQIDPAGDIDFFRFEAEAGQQYVIETRGDSDTMLGLFDSDGQTQLRYSDDDGEGYNARIAWTAPVAGTYHVAVVLFRDEWTGGYELCISTRQNDQEEGIAWLDDLDQALASAEDGQLVMVDFSAEWCGWSQQMEAETFSDPRVIEQARQFVCVRIDGDEHGDLLSEYGISGYPTVLFLNNAGEGVYRVVGFCGAEEFLAEMQRALDASSGDEDGRSPDDHPDSAPGTLVAVDGQCISGEIASASDVDYFWFEAEVGQAYVIETRGNSDTVVALFDQDGQTFLQFSDDDGDGANARIVWTAPASGTYHVGVGLYWDGGTGGYELCVRTLRGDG